MSPGKTIEEHEHRHQRDVGLAFAWKRAYAVALRLGSTKRAAQALATGVAVRRSGLSPRRVQMIVRRDREEIQPQRDRLEAALETLEPRRALRRRAENLLTSEQWEWIDAMPASVGTGLLQLIADGADAIRENARLRARLCAWEGVGPPSAKRKGG